jgi:ribulose-phosphate 3-epimerase
MDGRFVPNISMGFPIITAIRKRTKLPLDLHLMIVEPEKYLADFAAAGADMLTVHVEACPHLQRTLASIRELGARKGVDLKAGAALNPSTHPHAIDFVLDDLDLVLVMSVNPGFGGQQFIPSVYPKIRQIRTLLGARRVDVSIDGGVKVEHAKPCADHGASILVAGSAVFEAEDPADVIKRMRAAADA